MAYSLEIREKALDYLERCGSVPEVSKAFGVSQHTIRAWQRLKRDTGSLAKKPIDCSKRRRKIDDAVLITYLDEHPDAYLSEMAELFSCSVNAIHKKLKSMNISRKKDAANCLFAEALIADTAADNLLADKAYDTDAIRNLAASLGMDAVIPPKANRKEQLPFDRYLYRYRHLVENRFLDFKRWRGIATRYAKRLASFAAAIEIRIIAMWLEIL